MVLRSHLQCARYAPSSLLSLVARVWCSGGRLTGTKEVEYPVAVTPDRTRFVWGAELDQKGISRIFTLSVGDRGGSAYQQLHLLDNYAASCRLLTFHLLQTSGQVAAVAHSTYRVTAAVGNCVLIKSSYPWSFIVVECDRQISI